MFKFIIPCIVIAVILLIILIFWIPTIKYTGSTIRIFNKTFKGLGAAYVGKIVAEREQINVIPYPYVNSVFLCRPSKNKEVPERYYTYSSAHQKLYYLEDVSPRCEVINTEEESKFHELILNPIDKIVLSLVFKNYK